MARQDKTELRVAIARNIRLKMQQQGIKTLLELRKLSDVSQSMISTILSGKTSPRVDTIQRLAEALNCPASDLLQGDPKDIPVMKDEAFLSLYARYQLAPVRDREMVKRLLWGDSD
jgi:transcriptional regulator with XRE-family HTH domain